MKTLRFFRLLTVCMLSVAGLLGCQGNADAPSYDTDNLLPLGGTIPTRVFDVAGYDAVGKVTLIFLFKSGCDPCSQTTTHVVGPIWEQFKDRANFCVQGFYYGGNGSLPTYLEEHGNASFSAFYDTQRTVFYSFATGGYPRIYLFDTNGYLHSYFYGYSDALKANLIRNINSLL